MRTAMVVELDPHHRELLSVFLETMGFSHVWPIDTREEALEIYFSVEPTPSIVLIDQQLKRGNGLRLVSEIIARDEGARIIMLSSDPELQRSALEAGASEFIRKPYSIADIGRAINRTMRPGVVS